MKKRKQLSRYQARLDEAHKDHEAQLQADRLWLWCYRKLAKCKTVAEVIIPVRGRRPLRLKIEQPEEKDGNTAA